MERSPSIDAFLRDPVGRWVVASPTTVVFCATPALGGSVTWGAPSPEDTERTLAAYSGLRHPKIAPRFDIVLDGRGIERVDDTAMGVLLPWIAEHRAELAARVRIQYGVVADNLVGVMRCGILPLLGDTHDFRVVRDQREAFRALAETDDSIDPDALSAELEAAVASARGIPRELRELRDLLRAPLAVGGRPTIEDAARSLAVSVRTLQRVLNESGTSFRDEVRDARFAAVERLLTGGDDKIAAVASRVGLSENGLAQLVREKTGLTPAELRKRARG